MAGIPQVKLEHLVNGSWLDVTSRLLWSESGASLQIQRGVADDGAAMVGTASFTLDNSDGVLTPRRPGSPHYPYLIRFRPVRFTAFIGGSWRARHYGFLDSEVLTFGNETATDCRVTWSTIDHFGMAGLKALRSVAVESTAALGPLAYWTSYDAAFAAARPIFEKAIAESTAPKMVAIRELAAAQWVAALDLLDRMIRPEVA